jgi:hypothetical protein
MSTPVSGSISWTTPVTITSGDVVTATDLNNLNKDVAYLHARPWAIATQTASGTAIANPGSQVLFGGTGSGTWTATTSTTATGSITNSTGAFYVPIAGMYRITASAGALATTSAHWRIRLVGQTSTGTAVWSYTGNMVDGSTITGSPVQTSLVSVFVPIGTASSSVPLGNATSVYAIVDNFNGANITVLGSGSSGVTSPIYPTTFQIEYTGSSTGAY